MYKVLIVDDEVLVRVGLKTTINWGELGFEVVGDASNGESGLEAFRQYKPDVVFTDIMMPKKDGLWLVEKIREIDAKAHILMLTCYDDFANARKALQAGADDYILKSEVEDEELAAVMKKIRQALDERAKASDTWQADSGNKSVYQRTLLHDLIKKDFVLTDKTQYGLKLIGYPLEGVKYVFIGFTLTENDGKVIQAAINLSIEKLQEQGIHFIYLSDDWQVTIMIGATVLDEERIKKILLEISKSITAYFDCSARFIYTDSYNTFEDVKAGYSSINEASQAYFYTDQNRFLLSHTDKISFNDVNIFDLQKQYTGEWLDLVAAGNLTEAEAHLNQLSSELTRRNAKPDKARILYCNILSEAFSHYKPLIEQVNNFGTLERYHASIMNSHRLAEVNETVNRLEKKLSEAVSLTNIGHRTLLINRVCRYIEAHYSEKISLEDVAYEFSLSKHYLSGIFKKETGVNMTAFINQIRVDRAKALLLNTDKKVGEISDIVGYSNQQYFSKIFKKVTGMTIMAYKESLKK